MKFLDLFKRKNKETKPINSFNFPRDDDGIKLVVEWIKTSSDLIVDLKPDETIDARITPDETVFINVYTNIGQRMPSYKKGDQFATFNYEGLVRLLEENTEIAFIWLNPHSDSIQLNRGAFTSVRKIKENTKISIGKPAVPPVPIIEFLVEYAKNDLSIKRIYLALMYSQNEFSYAVYLDSIENKTIVHHIGPIVSKLCQEKQVSYPVDFIYDNFIENEEYLIYQS